MTKVEKTFPTAIDVQNRLVESFGSSWVYRPVDELVDVLDSSCIEVLLDLDGSWGEETLKMLLFKFIHFGGTDWAGSRLDMATKFYVDTSARISKTGYQPYASRDFITRNSNRNLFGTDQKADLSMYPSPYHFLETKDE